MNTASPLPIRRLLAFLLLFPVLSCGGEKDVPAAGRVWILEEAGFQTPESVLYDPATDVYLVSNVNGSPAALDGNGFISRVSPEGEVLELKWIDGAVPGVELSAPKGMAFKGDSLLVADVNSLRVFDRASGAIRGDVTIVGAQFLNDVALAPNGFVYVTDTDAHAIREIRPNGEVKEVFTNVRIDGPNGIVVTDSVRLVADYGGRRVYRLNPQWQLIDAVEFPQGMLDGLVQLGEKDYLVSSWTGSALYRLHPDGSITTLYEGIDAPADIGYDPKRKRVLVPHFREHSVEARSIEP